MSNTVNTVSESNNATNTTTPEPVSGGNTVGTDNTKARNDKRKKKRNPKSNPPKTKPLTRNAKFLEISSLIKQFKPVTINGSPTSMILKQIRALLQQHPHHFDDYPNHNRLSHLQKYFLHFIENHPQSTIYISFVMKPSDPDFPFDLDLLKINLSIPEKYPKVVPKIVLLNDNIPRGFAANIEIGFANIAKFALMKVPYLIEDEPVELVSGSSLKSQFLTLDKYLEFFLKQEKRETIKFIKTVKKKPEPVVVSTSVSTSKSTNEIRSPSPINTQIAPEILLQRNKLVNSMVDKLPVSLFKKSATENKYKMVIPIRNSQEVPELWSKNGNIEIMITIPMSYPQQEMTINIVNNFSTNLIIKLYKQQGQLHENEMVDLAKQYKAHERNLVTNFTRYDFKCDSLVVKMNKLVNCLGSFLKPSPEFASWMQLTNDLKHMQSTQAY